ncbi:MAG: helix-turn-helix transcriptional regulator [Telluria sp.]
MLKTIDPERPTMSPPYLTQVELAVRWRISPRTLERWRWAGDGPRFIKIGGLVRYRFEDIEGFEAEQLRQITERSSQNSCLRSESHLRCGHGARNPPTQDYAPFCATGAGRFRRNTLQLAELRNTTMS